MLFLLKYWKLGAWALIIGLLVGLGWTVNGWRLRAAEVGTVRAQLAQTVAERDGAYSTIGELQKADTEKQKGIDELTRRESALNTQLAEAMGANAGLAATIDRWRPQPYTGTCDEMARAFLAREQTP
jgi:hypothetical protein